MLTVDQEHVRICQQPLIQVEHTCEGEEIHHIKWQFPQQKSIQQQQSCNQ